MKTVDLSRYVTSGRLRRWYSETGLVLSEYRDGQKAAKELGLSKMAGEEILLDVMPSLDRAKEEFLSGLLGGLVRKQGLDKTTLLVTTTHDALRDGLSEYFTAARVREKENQAKKEKEASLGQWSKPQQFFVPDIGTIVRLTQDWTFRLHSESRNYDMFQLVGIDYHTDRAISPAWNRHRGTKDPTEVTFTAGTVLKIDRVYIRKGVGEYSSITFNIVKGKDSKLVHANGWHVFAKKGARFWAKLGDVNKMVVEVDTATLAEN